MKRTAHEAPIHRSIVAYLRQVMPDAIVHHSAGEGVRGGAAGVMDGAKRKAMGQVAGIPDIIVLTFVPIGTLFFEVKAPGGRVSAAQGDIIQRIERFGHRVAVVQSIDDVRKQLASWGVWTNDRSMRGSE